MRPVRTGSTCKHTPMTYGTVHRRTAERHTEKTAICNPERCPLTFSEFTLKEFEKDKEGNWIDEIPDGNDHSIDAVRYAMMDDVLRG